MRTFTMDLWEGFAYPGASDDGFRPTLDAYLLKSEAPRPAVLVLPGSGYVQCSPREAEALALRFNAAGYHAFVLWYSCAPRRHPVPILDCARAFTIIRGGSGEWLIDPSQIAMMGFPPAATWPCRRPSSMGRTSPPFRGLIPKRAGPTPSCSVIR